VSRDESEDDGATTSVGCSDDERRVGNVKGSRSELNHDGLQKRSCDPVGISVVASAQSSTSTGRRRPIVVGFNSIPTLPQHLNGRTGDECS